MDDRIFKSSQINTPIGQMIAIADEKELFLLEFTNRKNIQKNLAKFTNVIAGITEPIISIQQELKLYFAGELKEFKTPINFDHSSGFRNLAWEALLKIPYGKTCSYAAMAGSINKPSAFRAIANANAANQIAIVIPCHRVINSNGKLGGYAGGIERKQWLINHERQMA